MQNNNIDLYFEFRCIDEIPHFDKFPEHVQTSIEYDIADVIFQSFITPADEDYLSARLLALKGFHRAFFWSASQAVEKYLKAYLLLRGFSVCKYSHNLKDIFSKVCSIDQGLQIEATRHPSIKVELDVEYINREFTVDEFLNTLELHGNPDNRYNAKGVTFSTNYLFALDSFIHSFRKEIGVPDIFESLTEDTPEDLLNIFTCYNPWFQSDCADQLKPIPNPEFNLKASIGTTKLDYLTGRSPPSHAIHALRWLDAKMRLPREISKTLKS